MQLRLTYQQKWFSWILYKLKVYGNDRDGWELDTLKVINGDILIENRNPNIKEIADILIRFNIIKKNQKNKIEMEYDDSKNLITVFEKKIYKPIAILER